MSPPSRRLRVPLLTAIVGRPAPHHHPFCASPVRSLASTALKIAPLRSCAIYASRRNLVQISLRDICRSVLALAYIYSRLPLLESRHGFSGQTKCFPQNPPFLQRQFTQRIGWLVLFDDLDEIKITHPAHNESYHIGWSTILCLGGYLREAINILSESPVYCPLIVFLFLIYWCPSNNCFVSFLHMHYYCY